MKYLLYFSLALLMLLPPGMMIATTPAHAATIPTFSIVSVVMDTSVTIKTANFPANDTFDVLMNFIGTKGVDGFKVTTQASGAGGSFTATYSIPDDLKGEHQIAIRLESPTSGFFAYNWFYNNTSGSTTPAPTTSPSGYTGFPTFSIVSVVADTSVTIKTNNLPPDDTFDVLMNFMGTKGVDGIKVATQDSGDGGVQTFTYSIPDDLKGEHQIAIRMESPTSGFFAYNWFFNNTSGSTTPAPTATPGPTATPSGYSGFPTFSIVGVVKDQTVTVRTSNLPPDDSFDVRMGAMGTKGVGGIKVSTVPSGVGGVQEFTFNIPDSLEGSKQIAIRMESPSSGYFAYNWFYNSTSP